jgi:SAM-dependent methyltransferase
MRTAVHFLRLSSRVPGVIRILARPHRAALANLSAADVELEETLDNLDDADNYAAWIFELMAPYLGDDVLEVGAGHGTFTEILAPKAKRIVASDISGRCAGILRKRFSADPSVEVLHGSIDAAATRGPFDTAILINVLEHIQDDGGALQELAGLLKPGGRVILWVPAFSLLYSDFDRRIGHHRRYRRTTLRAQLSHAGYHVRDIRYVNAVGAIAWLVVARFLRRTPTSGTPVRVFDRYFVPVLKQLERRWCPPFGQSIFAVGVWPRDSLDK